MEPDAFLMFLIDSVAELAAMYELPIERSVRKQKDRLDMYCRQLIAASPM